MTYEAELQGIIGSMVDGLRKIASSKKLLADFIDLESRRIAKAATDLLAAFDDAFLKTLFNMVQLAKKHSDIEEADKRRSLEHALASQRKDLLRILQVLNVKAQVAIEEMTEKEIPFQENAKLNRLAKLSYEDLLNSLLDDTHPLD